MKALSLKQPFAELVGINVYESEEEHMEDRKKYLNRPFVNGKLNFWNFETNCNMSTLKAFSFSPKI